MVSEQDIESLDMYLDGELDDTAQAAVLRRLASEPDISQTFAQLEAHRALRMKVWKACEPTVDNSERWIAAIGARRQRQNWLISILDYRQQIAAAAACIAVFIMGWNWGANSGEYRMTPGAIRGAQPARFVTQRPLQGQAPAIEVRVTDAAGNLVDRKLFNTLEEAQRYTEEIKLQLQASPAH
jgi:anti-sigma factor RsiW